MGLPEPLEETNTEPAPLIGIELILGLIVAVLAGAFFGWLGEEVLEGDTQALDDRLRLLVN
ncbi:MAG: hypothetical protein ACAI18_17245, partial [Gemmatimonadales bacterium]